MTTTPAESTPDTDAGPTTAPGQDTNIRRAAIRGSAIILIAFGTSSGMRFVSNLLLTRLLFPAQFGIMALVTTFIMGLSLFSDIGIGQQIIQSRHGEDEMFLNTAWTVQVFRGAMVWFCACALAWPLSRFYERPELLYLLPAASSTALLGALESTRLFTGNRRLALGRISVVELTAQAGGIVTTLSVAAVTHSVWALIAGGVVSAIMKTVLSHTVLEGEKNRFAWDPEARRSLFEFGRWIFASTALTFLSTQSDRLTLGKLLPDAKLGLYAIAAGLAALPSSIIGQLSNRIVYPLIADAHRRGGKHWASIRGHNTRLLVIVAPVVGMGIALAPPVIKLLYRPQFWEVGPLVSILTLGTWIGAVSAAYQAILLAVGKPKYLSIGNMAKLSLFVALVFFVTRRFGLRGAAFLTLTELAYVLVAIAGCRTVGVVAWKSDLGVTLFMGVYCVCCRLLYGLIQGHGRSGPLAGILVVVVLTAGLVLALARRLKLISPEPGEAAA
ncbi:MAG TPA: oligosaccharide flippase family protein [Polyangia bacterium]|nr:oligosaccharide flippase family protein [Polyangia bacterium]